METPWLRVTTRILSATIGAAALLVGIATYPMLHNRYVFPLGRLYASISKGDSYGEVRSKFVAYYESRKSRGQAQFSELVVETDLLRTKKIPPSRELALYDLSVFDDVQLQVLFDGHGRVDDILFIGD